MSVFVVVVTAVVELLLIPGFLIYALGWKLALSVLAAFYFFVRPAVGSFRYSIAAAVVDNLFTASVVVLAFLRGYWPVGAALLLYQLVMLGLTRVQDAPVPSHQDTL